MEDITLGVFKLIMKSENKYFKDFYFADNIRAALEEPVIDLNKYIDIDKDAQIDIDENTHLDINKDTHLNISFENCVFDIPINFNGMLKIILSFSLSNCVFNKKIYFGNIEFSSLNFDHVIFNEVCEFYSCKYIENLSFTETTFNNSLSFDAIRAIKITEIKDAWFECTFNGKTNFNSVSFDFLNMSGSIIDEKNFIFKNCLFNKLALFRRLNLKSNVLFLNADLTNCSFLNSNFEDVLFSSTSIDIEQHIDYRLWKNKTKLNNDNYQEYGLYNIDDTISEITKNNLISEYKIFEKNFDNKKHFDIAGEFHQSSLDIESQYHPKLLKKIILWLYKTFSNYGESYKKSLIWFSLILVIFSVLYLFTG